MRTPTRADGALLVREARITAVSAGHGTSRAARALARATPRAAAGTARGARRAAVWTVRSGLRPTEPKVGFALALAVYVTLGAYLTLEHATNFGDALSRVSSAAFVGRSRDPHLGAIGFVYGPVPALLMVPFLWLADVWPALLGRGFLACLETSLFSAGTVAVLLGTFRELGVVRPVRWALVLLFAAHPLVLFYGGSGMSEPVMLLFLAVCLRALLRWLGPTPQPWDLTVAGTAAGLAYLTRLEALAAGFSITVLVGVVSLLRHRADRARAHALSDVALVGLPFAFCAGVWAVTSKVLVGEWVGYASSTYGAVAQFATASSEIIGRGGATPSARADYVVAQVGGLMPALIVLLVLALLLGLLRRDPRVLAVIAVLGSVLTLTTLTWIDGRTFGFLRFSTSAVPLGVVLAALLAGRPLDRPSRQGRDGRHRVVDATAARVPVPRDRMLGGSASRALGAVTGLALVSLSVPAAADVMRDQRLGPQESRVILALTEREAASQAQLDSVLAYTTERRVAAYLDALRLPPGSVVTDAASSFAVVVASRRMEQFVATPDRDFERYVADPVRFGASYLLVPRPGSGANFDALLDAYPGLYESGAGIAELVQEFEQVGDGASWRLYRLRGDGLIRG